MKLVYYFFAAVVLILSLMVLDQVWFDYLSPEMFWKIGFSLLVISVAVFLIYFGYREWVDSKKMNDDNFVD